MSRYHQILPIALLAFNLAHGELVTADDQSIESRLDLIERKIEVLSGLNLLGKIEQLQAEITTLNRQIDFLQRPKSNVELSSAQTQADEQPSMRKVYSLIAQQNIPLARSTLATMAQNPNDNTDIAEVHFWQGELAYQQKDTSEARRHFNRVINKYPQHNRAADSLFKLAEIAKESGEIENAKKLLATLKIQYPDSIASQFTADPHS
ncbi:MAG: tetratricopeptide repeat protein [Gammaproteobacteria bacterium]|nr:tetratricopeptide repeat protein [Gammaproteobacteria bacterium]